jgi:hypothetical protein
MMKVWVISREGCKKVTGRSLVGTLWFKERQVMPKREALKKKILDEAHTMRYSIDLESTNMYHDLRQQFLWTRMKREATRYVSKCDNYRKVTADYMRPGGLLQLLYSKMEVERYKLGLSSWAYH